MTDSTSLYTEFNATVEGCTSNGFVNLDHTSLRSYGSVTTAVAQSDNGSASKFSPLDDIPVAAENAPLLTKRQQILQNKYWEEARVLLRYALSVVCTTLIEYSLVITSIITVGHLSTEKLAGASLGSITAGVTGFSIVQGFACALDSLLPAAWTSEHPSHVGLWTQRMLVLIALILLPIITTWLNAEYILLHLRQDPEVARLAALYLRYATIGLPGYAFNAVVRRYFQAQGLLHVPSIITLIVAPVNIGLNYLLVWGPASVNLGFIGAPIATSISLSLMSILYFVYGTIFAPRTAWHPITSNSFRSLPKLLRMGITGVGQSAAEWWSWELISLAASQLGPSTLATQSVLVMVSSTTYQIPSALGVASAVRVGNLLGSKKAEQAQVVSRVAGGLALVGGLVLAAIFMATRRRLAYLFSADENIAVLVSDILPIVAAYQVFDGIAVVTAGILRACGKLGTGAMSNLIAYYVIGIPLGIYLTFCQGFGLKGLWIGLATSILFVATVLGGVVFQLDWRNQARGAKERIEDQKVLAEPICV